MCVWWPRKGWPFKSWPLQWWRTAALSLILPLIVACGGNATPGDSSDALFQESFFLEETGRWLLEGDESGRATLVNEQLLIEVDAPQVIQYVTLSEPTFSDFTLEVDVTQLAGDPESSAGVMFRLQSPDEFYRFDITASGLYLAERRNADGSWTRLVPDWSESSAIKQGLLETNRLKVAATGPSISLYVNDELLLQVADDTYSSGNIALEAGTFGRAGLQVAFDNVVVRRP